MATPVSYSPCPICYEPLSDEPIVTKIDGEDVRLVTRDIHAHSSKSARVHKAHSFCLYQWFIEVIFKEAPKPQKESPRTVKLTCPECKEQLSFEDAARASGLTVEGLESMIKTQRTMNRMNGMFSNIR